MSWVAAATALLTLLFALQQLVSWVGGWHAEKRRIAELVAVAAEQRASRHYAEAWASLDQAAQIDADNEVVDGTQEDLAMDWLRNARVRQGEQTFTELVKPLLPVLERGVLQAQASRKADLLAHAGWADFLRWREGARDLLVDAHYQRAVAVDQNNPFAHAMWGHWVLFTGNDLDAARQHFNAALKSGRERAYVHSLQLAAVLNQNGNEADEELLRIANEMRAHNDEMAADTRRSVFRRICLSDVRFAQGWVRSSTRIQPQDEIATVQWLNAGVVGDDYRADMGRFCEARAHAWAGDTTQALAILRSLAANAAGDAIQWDAKQTADRLAASRRR